VVVSGDTTSLKLSCVLATSKGTAFQLQDLTDKIGECPLLPLFLRLACMELKVSESEESRGPA
jgi:hypothetical protein